MSNTKWKLHLLKEPFEFTKGPLVGHSAIYATRYGIPVAFPSDVPPEDNAIAVDILDGIVVIPMRSEDQLHFVDHEGRLVPLPLKISMATSGLERSMDEWESRRALEAVLDNAIPVDNDAEEIFDAAARRLGRITITE